MKKAGLTADWMVVWMVVHSVVCSAALMVVWLAQKLAAETAVCWVANSVDGKEWLMAVNLVVHSVGERVALKVVHSAVQMVVPSEH